jgi:acyl carrier protein
VGASIDLSGEVRRIIAERLGVSEAAVQPHATFVDDLGADSLGLVELVLAFEEAFEIDIPDEETERIRTVQHAIDYVHKNVRASGSQGTLPLLWS